MSMYYILTYFAGSFGRYNMHAKVFCWLMTVYPIVTALTGFQFTNLLPYILQVVPTVTGLRSPGPPAPLPAVFCPSGAPFGPIHFTDYPLKHKYKDYTPEKILKLDPLACIQSAIRYNRQGLWIFSTPKTI
ncbi:hypothetical protein DSO57_1026145 [Entomophthora muscae]|uniref:Uncharacterized protein n=1 Tax=Entomophthora muscae TaxID=34485 RepID=A0ACC2TDL5_9FUNG|nr:hypothetical protein DSO57_1026145 [Entomophthora muscae]